MSDDRTLFDSFIEPFERLGSAGRTIIRGGTGMSQENIDDVLAALRGERRVTPQDFKQSLADTMGFDDLMFGEEGDRSWYHHTGNFIADVGIDMLTSPDSLISAPAKLLSKAKYLDDVGKAAAKATNGLVGEKEIFRGVVGATMGLGNVDEDDDIFDAVRKVTGGALMGTAASPALKAAGKPLKGVGNTVVDAMTRYTYPEVFEKLQKVKNNMDVSEAVELVASKETQNKVKAQANRYTQEVTKVIDELKSEVVARTGNMADGDAAEEVFRQMLGEGFGQVTNLRNSIDNLMAASKAKVSAGLTGNKRQVAKTAQALNKSRDNVVKLLKGEIPDGDVNDLVIQLEKKGVEIADDATRLNESTKVANEIMDIRAVEMDTLGAPATKAEKILEAYIQKGKVPADQGSRIAFMNAFDSYNTAQRQLVKNYRDTMKLKNPDFIGFEPINFHTVDLNGLNKIMPEIDDLTLGKVREGAVKRGSGNVKTLSKDLTLEEITKIGADRYAALFLTEKEKQARQLMFALSAARQTSDKGIAKGLRYYDDFMQLQKAVWLGGGFSWLINTLPENIMKAYAAAGPSAMLKTIGGGAANSLYKASYLNKSKKAREILEGDFLPKLMKTMTGKENALKLGANDPWLKVATDYGVVDNTFLQEAMRGIDEGRDIFRSITSSSKDDAAEALGQALNPTLPRKIADKIWQLPMARAATAFENAARLTTFKEVFKREAADFFSPKEIGELLKDPARIATATPAMLMQDKWKNAKKALEVASGRVNDMFYDYSQVSAFEKYVGKRLIPFYSFLTRDVELWAKEAFDNPRAGKAVEAWMSASGEKVDADERQGLPTYLKDLSVRKTKSGEYVTTPSLPLLSATTVVGDLADMVTGEGDGSNISSKLAPLLRAGYAYASNKDPFGRQIMPNDRSPTVRVPETVLTALPESVIESMGIARDPEDGRLYTNSKAAALASFAVANSPIDLPIVRQMVTNPYKERVFRDRENPQAMQFSPVKQAYVTDEQFDRNIKRAERAEENAQELLTPSERRGRRSRGGRRRRRR